MAALGRVRGASVPASPVLFTDKLLSSLDKGEQAGQRTVPRWHEAGHVPGLRWRLQNARYLAAPVRGPQAPQEHLPCFRS